MLPLIAIVGRPNVGKSALFNRLVKKKQAIVSEEYGTTRDVLTAEITLNKKTIEIADMAGIIDMFDEKDDLQYSVQQQAKESLQEADLILFCIDGVNPLTKEDTLLADTLRKSKKTVILVITKCDNETLESENPEIYGLGFKNPVFISSFHNLGIEALQDIIIKTLKKEKAFSKAEKKTKKEKQGISFSILGKPNVGKSSLFNSLTKKSKAVVSSVPGTTRDFVDSNILVEDTNFQIIDTAGLVKPGKVKRGIDYYSRLRTLRSIRRADVCLLVIDSDDKVARIDQTVSRYILEEKKGLIILVNKWDLSEKGEEAMNRFLSYLQRKFQYVPWAPVIFVSAKTGKNVSIIFDQVKDVYEERQKRIETGKLNRFIEQVTLKHPPTGTKRIKPKVFYTTQVEINPPHFILFVNEKEAFHFSWVRYLENNLREKFGFEGTPIIIELRNRKREDRKRN